MKEIGKAESISDYNQQISYLEDVLSQLEDLQILFLKDSIFKDWDKDIENQMDWIEEQKIELEQEKAELEDKECKEYDEELKAMNAEFERSRL